MHETVNRSELLPNFVENFFDLGGVAHILYQSVLFLFAITALGVYGVVLAGWAANNKYGMLGALRSSAQMFSYELALGLSWVGVIMLAGSFQIADIVNAQAGWFWRWNAFWQLPAFVVYFVAATAEVARIPVAL